MVALPPVFIDPTLEAADKALEDAESSRPPREYLGMSGIAHPCLRKPWFDWRWLSNVRHNATTLKRFEDGNLGEDIQAKRLRRVSGLTLITEDPETGRQIGYNDINGHFKGHFDGAVLGLLQANGTWHVWEHKQVGDKKQASLAKLKSEHGEKAALQKWDEIYYGQAVLYMHYSGMTRHYLTCSTPGGRSTISVRTEADPTTAMRLIGRAANIINSTNPPNKISNNADWFQCRMCDHARNCQGDGMPERHCRSCLSATPIADGKWYCEKRNHELSSKMQRAGCEQHRYLTGLVHGQQVDAAPDAGWVDYQMPDNSIWRDGNG